MHDPFDRRIGFLGVALVKGRLKNALKIWYKIKEDIDFLLRSNGYFQNVPFLYVQLTYCYGIKNDLKVKFSRPNKKYGDLPIALELDMKTLQWADQNNLDLLHDIFMIAALEALIQVGQKYKLPIEIFIQERSKYGDIPSTTEECETYQSSKNRV